MTNIIGRAIWGNPDWQNHAGIFAVIVAASSIFRSRCLRDGFRGGELRASFLLAGYRALAVVAIVAALCERLECIVSNKVLVVASGGGHWIQMRRLQPALDGLDVAFVSVHSAYAEEVTGHRFYTVRDATRWDRVGLVLLVVQLTFILIRERPHVVVTTGAAPGIIALALAKCLLRSRTMWIDSVANCEQISLSGRLARRFCDVWLTQWLHLRRTGGPDYWGAVL